MRRLGLLLAAGTLWLFLAAIPALADGGPHVKSINDGSLGISADSCAGCHRAHTAKGPMLINAADEEALCLTCHGSGGVGSTVDVMTGVQYKIALPPGSTAQTPTAGVLLGALRNGGFDQARIDAGNGIRLTYMRSATDASNKPFVGVGAPEDVTSSHLAMADNGLSMPGIIWGYGAFNATADPGLNYSSLSCASCHNPHGNGQFRILNPIADPEDPAFDTTANVVLDSGTVGNNAVKNYTVIQGPGANYYPYASNVTTAGYDAADGDYFRRSVPWITPADKNPITGVSGGVFTTTSAHQLNGADDEVCTPLAPATTCTPIGTGDVFISGVAGLSDGTYEVTDTPTATTFTINQSYGVAYAGSGAVTAASFASRIGGGTGTNWDAPNGKGANTADAFVVQMASWCTSCHTRYLADGNTPAGNDPPYSTDSGDAIFAYRHPTRQNRNCTECHVTHGTNANMNGVFSLNVPYPNGAIPGVTDGPDAGTAPDYLNGNSRLLKVDNRGTCQACHEPTGTVTAGTFMPTGATLPAFP